MRKPNVAVIGRPNVGKSTLVNRIIGARKAIVDDMPGVTRDRSYYEAEWQGRNFILVDTGGVMPDAEKDEHPFADLINMQVEVALAEADLVVFLVDGQAGITPVDEDIAEQLRRSGKPILLTVNKVDRHDQKALAAEFYALSLGEPHSLSALHGNLGVGDLLDEITKRLPEEPEAETLDARIKIALVGRPNVGKSSILNALLGEERSIVSDISGTTRDSIDVPVTHEGREFVLVDTAGIRKKGKVDYGVEMFSVDRSIRALRDADVTVMVLDATENRQSQTASMVTDQDKKIIEMSNEAGRGLVIVVNKWDLIPDKTSKSVDQFKKKLYQEIPHASFAPVLFTSAAKGQRLQNIYELATTVYENANRRVKTSLINEVMAEAFTLSPPAPIKNRRLKLLYATQVGVAPPTFILFVNDAKLMKDSYRRYLEKKLRENFEFAGTPLVIVPRSRDEKKGK
ncbi:MAG: GTP-binding protein EngA [Vampirovibrio sp.]|jgi:GTP-binding protein|nr:GTP-binding protein EngA [Vampirovibrio sp.]